MTFQTYYKYILLWYIDMVFWSFFSFTKLPLYIYSVAKIVDEKMMFKYHFSIYIHRFINISSILKWTTIKSFIKYKLIKGCLTWHIYTKVTLLTIDVFLFFFKLDILCTQFAETNFSNLVRPKWTTNSY